jgi:hypothetical protein
MAPQGFSRSKILKIVLFHSFLKWLPGIGSLPGCSAEASATVTPIPGEQSLRERDRCGMASTEPSPLHPRSLQSRSGFAIRRYSSNR